MRAATLFLTFAFTMTILSSFSQNNIQIREIIFIDEEFDLICDSTITTLVTNEDFLRFNYRYLLFNIETQSLNDIGVDFSNLYIYLSSSDDSISLIDCGRTILTDSSMSIHAYCIIKDQMIPGGRKNIHDDVYNNYQNLQNLLHKSLQIIYSKPGEFEYHLEIPQIKIVSPQLSSKIKYDFRHNYCPCSIEEVWSGAAQRLKFRQVYTDDACLMQLMENITKVIHDSQWHRDARCHYLSTTKMGADTMLEIHSYDSYGIYNTLLDQEIFGVCLLFDHEFYIDTSFAKLFYATDHTFEKRYDRKIVKENEFSFKNCYYHWLFKKNFCGIDLYESWTMEDFKDWYNLELDSSCFCNYKKMSIELIEEEPEEINISH